MLTMAIIGVAYTSFTGRSLHLYWQILAPVYGLICVFAGWRQVDSSEARLSLVWTQALHWLAFLVAMNIIYSPDVRDVENNNSAGLNLMTLLALGTFVAGVHVRSWQICAVGCLLALSVPAIAWVEQSALFLLLVFILSVFIIASIWWTLRSQRHRTRETANTSSLTSKVTDL
jgi:Flp pilus assembly protein TadB